MGRVALHQLHRADVGSNELPHISHTEEALARGRDFRGNNGVWLVDLESPSDRMGRALIRGANTHNRSVSPHQFGDFLSTRALKVFLALGCALGNPRHLYCSCFLGADTSGPPSLPGLQGKSAPSLCLLASPRVQKQRNHSSLAFKLFKGFHLLNYFTVALMGSQTGGAATK